MGRLNPSCLDTILAYKIKTLINGAIERQKLENAAQTEGGTEYIEPTITYDRFVEELSVRDSFTATLVEMLVKEVADRQTRTSVGIGPSTRRTLQRLADHYSERQPRTNSARSTRLAEYLSYPPSELNDLEDDRPHFENILDSNPIEGARIDSSLYDAFSSTENSWTVNTTPHSPTTRDDSPSLFLPPPRSPPIPTSTRLTTAIHPPTRLATMTSSGSSLSRQPTVRRLMRPSLRTSDFREFTSQRRLASRQSSEDDNNGEGSSRVFSRRVYPYHIGHRLARHEPPIELSPPVLPTPSASSPSPPPLDSPEDVEPDPTIDQRPPPRLRRGGLRAPESIRIISHSD